MKAIQIVGGGGLGEYINPIRYYYMYLANECH